MNNILSVGTKTILGAVVTIESCQDGSLGIGRIEVPLDLRRKEIAGKVIMKIANAARAQKIPMWAMIHPDNYHDYELTDGLRRAFEAAGFTPIEMDGETYPNDVELIIKE